MKELSNQKTMTSREAAIIANKKHTHLMEAIRKMEPVWEKINGSKFRLVQYRDRKGEMRPEYVLTKTESLFISAKFNDEIRAKLVLRWEELETKQHEIPQTYAQALEAHLKTVIALEESNIKLQEAQETIKENRPKVVFAESVTGSGNSILVREFAKAISDEDFSIGQNKLFEWMRSNGYLNKKNEPYQQYVERGYFEVIERSIGSGFETFVSLTTKITGAGQVYFAKKIKASYRQEK